MLAKELAEKLLMFPEYEVRLMEVIGGHNVVEWGFQRATDDLIFIDSFTKLFYLGGD